jgi:hypothetical protein
VLRASNSKSYVAGNMVGEGFTETLYAILKNEEILKPFRQA